MSAGGSVSAWGRVLLVVVPSSSVWCWGDGEEIDDEDDHEDEDGWERTRGEHERTSTIEGRSVTSP